MKAMHALNATGMHCKPSLALRAGVLLAAVWTSLNFCGPAIAHDGPQHVIEQLTLQMATSGQSAQRLYLRACEYRTLGQFDRAERDLRQALSRDPRHAASRIELAQVLLAQGQHKPALEVVDQALRLVGTPAESPPLRMLRCDALLAGGETSNALAECRLACRENSTEVEWLLKRSQIEAQLRLHSERIAELEVAQHELASGLLHIEWIDALLDAGRASQAIGPIEAELADARLQSSWLIRRARARQLLGKPDQAAVDLQAAIAEINQRLHPERPDLSLVADRGLAHALLGERSAAEHDLHSARALHADGWMLWRLEAALPKRPTAQP